MMSRLFGGPEATKRTVNVADVEEARRRIERYLQPTPVMESSYINSISDGLQFYFKCELFQKTGSFKARGGTNAVLKIKEHLLSQETFPDVAEAPLRVIGQSSGNHAQGLSWAASKCGFIAEIVMPDNTHQHKIKVVKDYGGRVHLGPCVQGQVEDVERVISQFSPRCYFVPSSAHPDIIAGQGTMAAELLEQVPDLDAIIASVGGGGMVSGIGVAAKGIKPGTKVFGAEPENADDCARSMAAGKVIINETWPDTVCDSLRVSINSVTFPYIMEHISGVIVVSDKEIITAMRMVWERMKLLIEPGAACAVAAALSPKFKQMAGPEVKRVGVILCGGNVDLNCLPWTK